jgi:hypothetical protein
MESNVVGIFEGRHKRFDWVCKIQRPVGESNPMNDPPKTGYPPAGGHKSLPASRDQTSPDLFDSVFLHLQIEGFAVDVQNAGSFGFVIACFLQGLYDHLALLYFL